MSDISQLKKSIRNILLEAGFIAVRFARASAVSEIRMETWLQNGFHGDMDWLARNKHIRHDPRLLNKNAKTVISLALPYLTKTEAVTPRSGISKYALGTDYHKVIKKILKSCITIIQDEVDRKFEARIAVDSAPVMEKYWAVASGLGWQGKNSNILNKEFGSFFFLAELVCNIEIPADSPVQDYCGTCTKCIDACPTKAIVAPYVVDSRKCLSYQTIENKSALWPDELSSNHSGWIFGCDICQDVCPWNKFAIETPVSEFFVRKNNILRHPAYWFFINESEFRIRFRSSAVMRAGYRKFIENVKVILNEKESGFTTGGIDFYNSYSKIFVVDKSYWNDPKLFYIHFREWANSNRIFGNLMWENWDEYIINVDRIIQRISILGDIQVKANNGKHLTRSLGITYFDFCEWTAAKWDASVKEISTEFMTVKSDNFLSFIWHVSIYLSDKQRSHFDQLMSFDSLLKIVAADIPSRKEVSIADLLFSKGFNFTEYLESEFLLVIA